MSVERNELDKAVGKKIKVYLRSGSLPFRIGILMSVTSKVLVLDDNGKMIIVKQDDWSNVEGEKEGQQ